MTPAPGALLALVSALLFGASTPFAKLLLDQVDPWMLAGILYLGSGAGLLLVEGARRLGGRRVGREARLRGTQWGWLALAILFGGVLAPGLLMHGLAGTSAAAAALLLNLEAIFTALLAWFVFGEHFDRRIALGMAAISAGALVLSWPGQAAAGRPTAVLAIAGACLAWAIDNNLTRKVALTDPVQIAWPKGARRASSTWSSRCRPGRPSRPPAAPSEPPWSGSSDTASAWCSSSARSGTSGRPGPERTSPWPLSSAPSWPCSSSAKSYRCRWSWPLSSWAPGHGSISPNTTPTPTGTPRWSTSTRTSTRPITSMRTRGGRRPASPTLIVTATARSGIVTLTTPTRTTTIRTDLPRLTAPPGSAPAAGSVRRSPSPR